MSDNILIGLIVGPPVFWLFLAANRQQDRNLLGIQISIRKRGRVPQLMRGSRYYRLSRRLSLLNIPVAYTAIPFHLAGYGLVRNLICIVAGLIFLAAFILHITAYIELLRESEQSSEGGE